MNTILNFILDSKRLNMILSILLVLSVLLGIKQCNDKNEYELKVKNSTKEIKTKTQILERYVDSAGRKHTIIKDNIIPYHNSKDRLVISPGIIDTVSAALKIAKEQINDLSY